MGWRRVDFKGKQVWVEVGEDGAPKVAGGRVPIRYSDKPGAKVYGAGASRLGTPTGPTVEMEAGIAADAAPAKSSRGSGFGKAGTRTVAQAAAAAEAAAELVASLPAGTAIAYTDGGCKGNPGPAGSGAYLVLPDGREAQGARSLGVGTNNIAELTAVEIALDMLDEAGVPAEAPVALLTDSQYGFGVLAKGWKAKANRELILALRERLAGRPGVALHWVAGHAGVPGNERADALATAGVQGQTFTRWS